MLFCHFAYLVKLHRGCYYEVMTENKLFTLAQLIALRRRSRSDVNAISIVEQLKLLSMKKSTRILDPTSERFSSFYLQLLIGFIQKRRLDFTAKVFFWGTLFSSSLLGKLFRRHITSFRFCDNPLTL